MQIVDFFIVFVKEYLSPFSLVGQTVFELSTRIQTDGFPIE